MAAAAGFRDLIIFTSYMGPVPFHGTLTFLHLRKRDNDFFGVFSYGTGTFFCKIIFWEVSKYPWTFYPFIITTIMPQRDKCLKFMVFCIAYSHIYPLE